MTKKYLVGAAAAALLAATGTARAADVMPVVVVVTPAVPAVAVGPTVTVEINTSLYAGIENFNTINYAGLDFDGEMNVVTANGWGFNLSNYAYVNVAPGVYGGSNFRAELYRVLGNAQVGFFVRPYQFSPLDIEFGPTFRYKTARIDFMHETQIYLYPGTLGVEFANDVTLHVNDRLDIGGYFDFEVQFGGGFDIDIGLDAKLEVNNRLTLEGWAWADIIGMASAGFGGEATFKLGALSPYIGAGVYLGGGLDVEVWAGVDYERQIGTGPLTFTAGVGIDYDVGGGIDAYANIGLRLNIGNPDNLLFRDD